MKLFSLLLASLFIIVPSTWAQSPAAVTQFKLINAQKGTSIKTLKEGTIDLAKLPTRNITLRAVITPNKTGSVRIKLNKLVEIDNIQPYALGGGEITKFNAFNLVPGKYTIEAIAYTKANAKGKKGNKLTLKFTVIDSAPPKTPTIVPTAVIAVQPSTPTVATATATSIPTSTNTPLPTNTTEPSATAVPTNTALPTNTTVPTITALPTNTAVPTSTAVPTNTAIPTNTALPTATNSATPTNTSLPTSTHTSTPTSVPSSTATSTATATATRTATATNTALATATNTSVPTPTSTVTPTFTAIPYPTPSATPTQSSQVFSIRRVSVGNPFVEGNLNSYRPAISADGKYLAFSSEASNFVAGDSNFEEDVFLKDLETQALSRLSSGGYLEETLGYSTYPSISANGRFIAFYSIASDLVPSDTNNVEDVFLKDSQSGLLSRISTSESGSQANNHSFFQTMSSTGRYVAFTSRATNLVAGDTNEVLDVFVKDTQSGAIVRASTNGAGGEANDDSTFPYLSADGTLLVFQSSATNLVPNDSNNADDVFIKNLSNGSISRVSIGQLGNEGNGNSTRAVVSADGRYVTFQSAASDLVDVDTNDVTDVFQKDLQTGTLRRVSVGNSGIEGSNSSYEPAASADGRFIAFFSYADNFVPGDANDNGDVYVKDMQSGSIARVSISETGADAQGLSFHVTITASGALIGFMSDANNLVAGDNNAALDIFLASNPLF